MEVEESRVFPEGVAYALAPYIDLPLDKIPDFKYKIVALVEEWVSTGETYSIPFYDEYHNGSAPPQSVVDTPSISKAKRELFTLMDNSSQRRILKSKQILVDKINAIRNTYVRWFYHHEGRLEIAAYFNVWTIPHKSDTDDEKKYKDHLLFIFNKIQKASNARGDQWIDQIAAFIGYWAR